jgi:hypothetical protein
VRAGLFASSYRPLPVEWTYIGKLYHNERSVLTAKTGWNFSAAVRPWMPFELSAVLWFDCDDSATAPRVPVYTPTMPYKDMALTGRPCSCMTRPGPWKRDAVWCRWRDVLHEETFLRRTRHIEDSAQIDRTSLSL